jgi:hypothetical protein
VGKEKKRRVLEPPTSVRIRRREEKTEEKIREGKRREERREGKGREEKRILPLLGIEPLPPSPYFVIIPSGVRRLHVPCR